MADRAEEEEIEETEETPKSPDYEGMAREKGWRPPEEFEGDDKDYVSAEEFIKREPLFNKIKVQSKELKEMKRTVEAMATHFKKQTELEVRKAIAALKDKRKDAIEVGDVDAVDKIDQEIEQQKQAHTTEEVASPPAEITEWVEQNKWFESDNELKEFAIAFNQAYINKHPGDLQKSLVETTKAVKAAYPEKFKNPKREEPPPVSGGGKPASNETKYSIKNLSQDQKLVYNQMVKQHKVVSHDEFFKGLEDIGELNG